MQKRLEKINQEWLYCESSLRFLMQLGRNKSELYNIAANLERNCQQGVRFHGH